jgi:hypothetical protein
LIYIYVFQSAFKGRVRVPLKRSRKACAAGLAGCHWSNHGQLALSLKSCQCRIAIRLLGHASTRRTVRLLWKHGPYSIAERSDCWGNTGHIPLGNFETWVIFHGLCPVLKEGRIPSIRHDGWSNCSRAPSHAGSDRSYHGQIPWSGDGLDHSIFGGRHGPLDGQATAGGQEPNSLDAGVECSKNRVKWRNGVI